MMKKGLGKGLGALITSANSENEESGILEIKINDIEPNINQPRKFFDDDKLFQLSESIKQHGIMQPIIVKKEQNIYRIVAGERRWRAARMAGIATVPVIVKELSNKQVMEMALIENLQREDLNAIEEAEAYERLIKEYNLTQEEVSTAVGKSRSAVANSIRLLCLSEKIRGFIVSGQLSSGHARALIVVEDKDLQLEIAEEVIKNSLNVRETEKLVKKYLSKKPAKKTEKKSEVIIELEDRLKNIFGTKVQILSNNKKGKIMIEYYSNDELDRILEMCGNISKK
jgi:ParB family transcriptional regulator, chromosome partitioning protein